MDSTMSYKAFPLQCLILLVIVSLGFANDTDIWKLYTIEGKVITLEKRPTPDWLSSTQVLVNGGEHIGILREDGSFVVNGLTPGSYIVDVVNPQYAYESARVEITSKGRLRARKVNHIQPSVITHVPYPLKMNPTGPYKYFVAREQWRITDVLMSPMVLMMVLPLLLIVVLPKMMSDPETRKEMEQVTMPKYELPEFSEVLASYFGGKDVDKKQKAVKKKN